MQRAVDAVLSSLRVEPLGDGDGVGVLLDDGVEGRSAIVDIGDALQVEFGQRASGEFAGFEPGLQLGDGLLLHGDRLRVAVMRSPPHKQEKMGGAVQQTFAAPALCVQSAL